RSKRDWSSDVCSSDLIIFEYSPDLNSAFINLTWGAGGSAAEGLKATSASSSNLSHSRPALYLRDALFSSTVSAGTICPLLRLFLQVAEHVLGTLPLFRISRFFAHT